MCSSDLVISLGTFNFNYSGANSSTEDFSITGDYYETYNTEYYAFNTITGIEFTQELISAFSNTGNNVLIAKLSNGSEIYCRHNSGSNVTVGIKRGATDISVTMGTWGNPTAFGSDWGGCYFAIIKHASPTSSYFGTERVGFMIFRRYYYSAIRVNCLEVNGRFRANEQLSFYTILDGVKDANDPYVGDVNQTPDGGYGSFDYSSEDETPPALPALSAANAGFITLWNPTITEIGDLADYLWGPSFSIASWQKLWNDPMQCLLSLGIVPVSPTTGTRRNIFFGNADTGIESTPVTDQFVIIDMGSMTIEGRSASYMDYSPYCKASIFLPYCGTYALDVDEIMDAVLSLEYHIDIYTGACVAYLTVSNRNNSDGSTINNVLYQFTGNCLASIPVTSADHSQLLQSLLFMGASIAATVATSGAGAPIEGLAAEGEAAGASGAMAGITAGSAINTVMSMKPNVMHSGNLSSTAGLLGAQKPHVTFIWSNLCRPDAEYKLSGMPLQKSGTLSDFSGFTIVSACHMDNILCTDAERALIEQALGRGVII